jgi:hypothetical protein
VSEETNHTTNSEAAHEAERWRQRANVDALKELFADYRVAERPNATPERTTVQDLIDWVEFHP